MNSRIKILFLILLFSLSAAAQHSGVLTMPVFSRALQSADFEPIMPYLNDRLEIGLPDENLNIVSKKQAKAILIDYFKRNKVIFVGFQKGTVKENLQTLTYIAKTINKTFTIFVVLKNDKIIGMKISVEYIVCIE